MIFSQKNRFELHCSLDKDEARRAIRSILDVNPRAPDHIWGFAIGRLVWIIQSFGSSNLPTIWGWIHTTPHGVTIYGLRQVSLAWQLTCVIAALAVTGYAFVVGPLSALGLLAFPLLAFLSVRWADQHFVAESDRMLGKLAKAIGAELPAKALAPTPRTTPITRLSEADEKAFGNARLIVNGDARQSSPTQDAFADQCAQMGEDEFIILERGDNQFIQALRLETGFLIEHQCGGLDNHFRASELLHTKDTVIVFEHYLATAEPHPDLDWKRIKL